MVIFSILVSICFVSLASAQTPPYTKFLGYDDSGRAMYGLEVSAGGATAQFGRTSSFSITPNGSVSNIGSLIGVLQSIVDAVIPFLIGLAILLIIYGILGFIAKTADEEKRAEAKNFIIWGIIGVFVMVSIWGLVNILVGTFGLGAINNPNIVRDTYGKAYNALTGAEIVDPSSVLNTEPKDVIDLITRMNVIGSRLIPFFFAIAFLILIYGIVNYIRQGDNEEKRAEGRMFIIWGIVSIFVMLSIWGLVNILIGTFGLTNTMPTPTQLPTL